jgi:hypothetical protein
MFERDLRTGLLSLEEELLLPLPLLLWELLRE